MVKLICLLMIASLTNSCAKSQENIHMLVEEIEGGKWLEQAIPTSVDDFFQRRMENVLSKTIGKNWHILFDTTEYAYYGKPLKDRKGVYVSELYKVGKIELLNMFPGYKTQDGLMVKPLVYEHTIKGKEAKYEKNCTEEVNYKFELLDEYISVVVTYEAKYDKSQVKKLSYNILLDKVDLSIEKKEQF